MKTLAMVLVLSTVACGGSASVYSTGSDAGPVTPVIAETPDASAETPDASPSKPDVTPDAEVITPEDAGPVDSGPDLATCRATACSKASAQCGALPATCGGQSVDCGVCQPGYTCGDNNQPNRCGVKCADNNLASYCPLVAKQAGADKWTFSLGCGGIPYKANGTTRPQGADKTGCFTNSNVDTWCCP